MRYLVESFALSALRRGNVIAQFLGPVPEREPRAIMWVEIEPSLSGYEIVLYAMEDSGDEHFCDLWEFMPANADEEFGARTLARTENELSALESAERHTRATRDRWVNRGVVQDEYRDYVRAGRPQT